MSADRRVLGIGNAIVDVLAHTEERELVRLGLAKGSMTLIEQADADALYARIGPAVECSGGSAANTIAGIASLGGDAAFIGKVRDDQLGAVFTHDLRSLGVRFQTPPATHGASTARCFVLVTPDGQRTMQTYLGVSTELHSDDIDVELVANCAITYLEGYLFDRPEAQQAFVAAARIAHQAGRQVALSLSDSFCVERHRQPFLELVDGHVDILFANEAELTALYQVDRFDDALQAVRGRCDVAALTRSEKGAVVLRGHEVHVIDAEPVEKLVDTTGAGDLFAAGFLYGMTHRYDLASSGRIGAKAAAAVLTHFGARPERPLRSLIEE